MTMQQVMNSVAVAATPDLNVSIESGDDLLVDRVFHFAFDMRFSHGEIARAFGLRPRRCGSFDDIVATARNKLQHDPLYRERINNLLAIKAGLEKKFGEHSVDAMVTWLILTKDGSGTTMHNVMQGSNQDMANVAIRVAALA